MNNFSEKDLVSIQDLAGGPFLKKVFCDEDRKTQTSINPSDETQEVQNIVSSSNQVEQNQTEEITTVTSDINPKANLNKQSAQFALFQISLKNLSEGSIYFEGTVFRKERGMISSWEKRYLVLTKQKLFFFEDQTKTHLLGCVYIKYLPVTIITNNLEFQLSLNDQGQTIILKGVNQIESFLWKNKMNDVIAYCQNEIKVQIRKFNRSIYEQKDFILEEEFLEKAETGDLLLISSDNSASYLQKFFTHSQFNHVALIFKYKNQTKIFEANQDDGVSIYDWKQYLQTFKDHRRFAWRKLVYGKKSEFEQKLKQLAKKYLGNSYSLSASKLLRRTSSEKEDEKDREFFCSQIVAKIYKSIRLLDQQISSVRYWPITFTSRGQLNLLDGAFLSTQKNILLSKHLKL